MNEPEDPFDCWESHFKPTRKKCLKCADYSSCVYQQVFDLLYHKKELKLKNEWDRDYYHLLVVLHHRIIRKESFDDILDQLRKKVELNK